MRARALSRLLVLPLERDQPASDTLPRAAQITVAWGASVLFTRRLDPIRSLRLIRGAARLLVQADGLCLVLTGSGGERAVRVRRGDLVEERVGDYVVTVDCCEDEAPVAAREAVVTKDAALGQATSIAVHGALLAALLLYRAPSMDGDLAALELEDAVPRPTPLELAIDVELPKLATDDVVGDDESGPATDSRDDPRAVPGAVGHLLAPRAARGIVGEARGQTTHASYAPNAYEKRPPALDDLWTTTLIGLARPAEASPSPWDGAAAFISDGTIHGVSSGDVAALGDEGFHGLGLSGIGEGGGHGGMGVAWGGEFARGSRALDDPSMSYAVGRFGSHKVRAPRISGCASMVSGRLPAETVQRIVRQNSGQFRACYEKSFGMRENAPEGRVTVNFVIGRDGSVSSVSGSGDLPGNEVAACVTRAFGGLSFPQPEGGTVRVTYPIVFTPN